MSETESQNYNYEQEDEREAVMGETSTFKVGEVMRQACRDVTTWRNAFWMWTKRGVFSDRDETNTVEEKNN